MYRERKRGRSVFELHKDSLSDLTDSLKVVETLLLRKIIKLNYPLPYRGIIHQVTVNHQDIIN